MAELLSPAGNMDALKMAVQNGADAVYFGGPLFNARQNAQNFTIQQMEEAFDYCHERNVKAYVTLNVLLHDNELEEAFDFVAQTANLGADAFILQDIGLLDLLSRYTNIPLHASTQMSLHNAEGINLLAQNTRISRVILARETQLEDIKHIKANTKVELEAFVHGALCVSFSGQCLISSLTGGRSGNRGVCAQVCRMKFDLEKDGSKINSGYLLSPKDLCTVDYLKSLIDSGINSLKIEGRMKRPEYVGIVTKQYRMALDALLNKERFDNDNAIKELLSVFNRGGFTKGYYINNKDIIFSDRPNNNGILIGKVIKEQPNDRMEICADLNLNVGDSIELRKGNEAVGGGVAEYIIKNNERVKTADGKLIINAIAEKPSNNALIYKTTDIQQLNRINLSLNKEQRKELVKFNLTVDENKLYLEAEDSKGNKAECECGTQGDYNNKTNDEDIKKSLAKLGGTPFAACEININRNADQYIPAKDINEIRRKTVEQLLSFKRNIAKNRYDIQALKLSDSNPKTATAPRLLAVETDSAEKLAPLEKYKADFIYFKPDTYNEQTFKSLPGLLKYCQNGEKLFIYVPNVTFSSDIHLLRKLLADYKEMYYGILADGLAGVALADELNKPRVLDAGLNTFNTKTALFYKEHFQAEHVTLSPELNYRQIEMISNAVNSEMIYYGRTRLMTLVHCPKFYSLSKTNKNPCQNCKGDYHFTDRYRYQFPLKTVKMAGCLHYLYNSKITSLIQQKDKLDKTQLYSLRITADNTLEKVLEAYYQKDNEPSFRFEDTTLGHFNKGV